MYSTGPWWLSGLERHSFVLVMLKVEGRTRLTPFFFEWIKSCKNALIRDLFRELITQPCLSEFKINLLGELRCVVLFTLLFTYDIG